MGCNGWGCSLLPGDLSLNPSLASAWSWAGTLGKSLSFPFSTGAGWYREARLLETHRWAPSGLASGGSAE